MKYLYGIKGCGHCDSRNHCPKELKNSHENLLTAPREIKEKRGVWWSFCGDFLRLRGNATRLIESK